MITQIPLGGSSGSGPYPAYPPVTEIDAVPSEGATIATPATREDVVVRLSAGAQRTSVSVVLPNPASWRIRQIAFIHSTDGINELMVTAAPGITVNNFMADIQPGDCLAYFRISETIWARIQ